MKPPLPVLNVDLLIEHGGHQLKLRGSGTNFVAKFPTILSILHFLRIFWSSRKQIPQEAGIKVEWRQFRILVKSPVKDQNT